MGLSSHNRFVAVNRWAFGQRFVGRYQALETGRCLQSWMYLKSTPEPLVMTVVVQMQHLSLITSARVHVVCHSLPPLHLRLCCCNGSKDSNDRSSPTVIMGYSICPALNELALQMYIIDVHMTTYGTCSNQCV